MTIMRARFGAKYFCALLATGLMTSTAARADLPLEVVNEIKMLEDVTAEVQPSPLPDLTVAPEPAFKHLADGEASYYGRELAGNKTASGERFNPMGLTAAHRTLPLGTKLKVTNKSNGKSVVVRINDRGPFVKHRLIDVSLGAAHQIGMVRAGKAQVRLELLS
jgi:rare lipoprotein A